MLLPHWKLLFNGVFPQISTEEPHPWQLYPFFSPVCIPTDPHWGTRPLTAISFLFTCLYSHRSPLRKPTPDSYILPFHLFVFPQIPAEEPDSYILPFHLFVFPQIPAEEPDSYILPFHLYVFPQIPTEEPNPWQLYPSFSPVCIPTDPRWGTRPLTAISFLFACLYSHRSPAEEPDSYILPFHLYVFPQIPTEEPNPWQLYPSFSSVCIPTDPRWGTRPLTAISFLFTCLYSHRSPLRNPTPDSYILPFHLYVFPQIPAEEPDPWQLYPSFSPVCIPTDPRWGNRPLTAISFLFTCLYSHRSPLRNPTPDSYILPFHLYVFPQIPTEEPNPWQLYPSFSPVCIPTDPRWGAWQLYPSFSLVCIPTDPHWGTQPLTAISFLFTCMYSHRSPLRNPTPDSYILPFHLFVFPQIPAEEPDSYILPFHLYVFPQIPTEEPNPWQLYPSFSSVCIPTDPRWGTRTLTAISFLFTCLYSHR